MRFHILTFGCQMNVADSDWLSQTLVSRGWTEAPEEDAQVFLVTTCSVREKPEPKRVPGKPCPVGLSLSHRNRLQWYPQ